MPELPEVEVVRQELQNRLIFSHTNESLPRLEDIKFHRKDLRTPIPIGKIKKLVGEQIESIARRSKYLLLNFKTHVLISHLGMSGTWRFAKHLKSDRKKHDHIEIFFSDGSLLIYNDPRRFGIFEIEEKQKMLTNKRFIELGPEPFSEEFSATYLAKKLVDTEVPIKVKLMDAKLVVGIGNIYASEILFRAKISPLKSAKKIKPDQLEILVHWARQVLSEAIKSGGSSISDFKRMSEEPGSYQKGHLVYGREKQDCLSCGKPIIKIVQAGRSTFWCRRCQK